MASTQKQSDRFYVGGTASVAVPVVEHYGINSYSWTGAGCTLDDISVSRSGNMLKAQGHIVITDSGEPAYINLPAGITFDSTKLYDAGLRRLIVGVATTIASGVNVNHVYLSPYYNPVLPGRVYFTKKSTSNELSIGDSWSNFIATGERVTFDISIPILEWQTDLLVGTTKSATATEEGLVYKKQHVTSQADSSWTENTEADVGSATLTIQAGTYLVSYGSGFRVQSNNMGTGVSGRGYLHITDDSNTYITTSDAYAAHAPIPRSGADGTTDQYVGNYHNKDVVVIASETIVKLRARIYTNGASDSVFAVNEAYMVWEKLT